jgi:menaquinone-dependent protoporphyrinogen oxidase
MTRILIVYGSTEGHTTKVAAHMAEAIRAAGNLVELHEAKELRKELVTQHFDGIIVGGSVHAGDHQSSLREFVKRNREVLESVPSAFFSVSLANADADEDEDAAAESKAVIDKFIAETGWQPKRVEQIAGALVYTQYNLFIRHLMKLIAKSHGRTELDTSRDFDFTDWDAVGRFAVDFAQSVTAATETATVA